MKRILPIFLLLFSLNLSSQVQTLQESIYFGLGKSRLNRAQKNKLDSILFILKASKSYVGEIKGHTCTIGSNKINKVVSNLRALNVLNYLVDKGANRENFTYQGFSSSDPRGDNSTERGRALNRRTDIEIILSLFDEPIHVDNEEKLNKYRTSPVPADLRQESVGRELSQSEINDRINGYNTNSNNVKVGSTTASTAAANTVSSAPPIELGPDFVEGKIPKAGAKLIKSTNGIILEVDKNSLVSGSSEPIDLDFRDYTQNYDIIKKGMKTTTRDGKCRNLSLIGAFSTNFTQEYQELSLNSKKPVVVSIPSEYFPNAKLFSNHRMWTADTLNKLSYNHDKKAYEVSVINNSNIIGVFDDVPDTVEFLRVKIKGMNPKNIKPYVIYDNCNISMCCKLKRRFFLVPINRMSSSHRIRFSYKDYSSRNGQSYSINYDITNLDITKLKQIETGDPEFKIYKYQDKITVSKSNLDKSSLCDQ